ncbi:MAG: aspartate/glutamate racemase family protein [Acidobacteria bacterium]|nr:aspartate/glutamate racemase family protein [Acidobacteriota bacterium]
MKTVGLVGGIAPESTIDYYRSLIAEYRSRAQDDSYPSILINSIDLTRMLRLVVSNELDALTDYLSGEIVTLVKAGVDFVVLASNTPHIVFDDSGAVLPFP